MGERRGTKGLELWCKRMTEGYPGVKVDNMTTSWRDGLAFCAMIHHFRPDLIDFSKLNKNNVYYNNELAFRIAEDHLGIPALLEPEDMVEYQVPDRLSILTYLSQFYQAFAVNQSNSPTKIPAKRAAPTDLQMHMVSASTSSPPKKHAVHPFGVRKDPCAKCGLPVFIAERLNIGKTLYHRTCFRCARCDSQLTLANYYETENNEFCCETCPDEERTVNVDQNVLSRSLSDEEKTASLKEESDPYSANFENVLENPGDDSLKRAFTLDQELSSKFVTARSEFLTTQMDVKTSDSDSSEDSEPPDLPTSAVPRSLHSENIGSVSSNNLLPNLSDSYNSKQYESQTYVTKDSISTNKGSVTPSIRSRIKLFEGGAANNLEIRKSDVHKKSPSFSEVSHNVNSESRSLAIEGVSSKEFSDNYDGTTYHKSVISFVEDSKIETSAGSESYQADVSRFNDDISSSTTTDSVIVKSSEISGNTSPPLVNEENGSVIVISSESHLSRPSESSSPCEVIIISSTECSDQNREENAEFINIASDDQHKDLEHPEDSSKSSKLEETSENIECVPEQELEDVECPEDSHVIPEFSDNQQSHSSEINKDIYKKQSEERGFECPEGAVTSPKFSGLKPDCVKDVSDKSPGVIIEYPEDLNPFDDEEKGEDQVSKITKPATLNPFGDSDEEEDEEEKYTPVAAPRKLIRVSKNPFESDDEEEDEVSSLPPQPAVRKLIRPSKISLEPICSDSSFSPYTSRSPVRNAQDSSSLSGSARKKKPAPKPPTAASIFYQDATESPLSSLTSSPSQSVCHSPKGTIRSRKTKRAPLPPCSTPSKTEKSVEVPIISPIVRMNMDEQTEPNRLTFRLGSEENLKDMKDERNRNKQHSSGFTQNDGPSSLPNKSTYGKWKRRKGQAPARPVAQRRTVKSLPINEIKHELELIEVQQLGLEKQGVKLETLIREKSEAPGTDLDEILPPEVEDMVLQLFELVNEKNELFRRQTELMYLRREHRLEEEQAEIEYQLRCLWLQPDANKTDSDKYREEELINRKLELVERRNEIVDCLEMDRQREAQEDNSIRTQMNLFSMKRDVDLSAKKKSKKEKHKHKKDKEKKSKSKSKTDIDKDIDESEKPSLKEKKKKKILSLF